MSADSCVWAHRSVRSSLLLLQAYLLLGYRNRLSSVDKTYVTCHCNDILSRRCDTCALLDLVQPSPKASVTLLPYPFSTHAHVIRLSTAPVLRHTSQYLGHRTCHKGRSAHHYNCSLQWRGNRLSHSPNTQIRDLSYIVPPSIAATTCGARER